MATGARSRGASGYWLVPTRPQDNPRARRGLRGAMEGLLDSIGAPVQPTYKLWIGDRCFGAVKQALGARAYEQAVADGRAMSLSQAVDHAMDDV